MVELDRPPPTI